VRPRKTDRHLPRRVYRRHGAYYYVRQDGKWQRLGKGLEESLAAYARTVEKPASGMPALIDRVLAHISPKLAPSTVEQYTTAARYLKTALADFEPSQVLPRHVAAIKVDLRETPNMANRVISFLRQVFDHALEAGLIDSNPALGIKRHSEKKRGRYITDEEFDRIYQHAPERLQIIMDLLYLTGQRVNDVLGIRREDVTPHGIAFQPSKTKTSTGARVIVKTSPALSEAVQRCAGKRYLLEGRWGSRLDYRSVSLQWQAACEKAGVEDAQLRDLRAKSLTDAKAQGLDPTALASHHSAAMTARYIRRRETPVVEGPTPKVLDGCSKPH
jgi:integrase